MRAPGGVKRSGSGHRSRVGQKDDSRDLAGEIVAVLPDLHRYALSLTRDPANADDLVQEALARAVDKFHLWQPGTNLRAWLFTILHNRYADNVRHAVREGAVFVPTGAELIVAYPAPQVAALQLRDLQRALPKLSEEQRDVLLMVAVQGEQYDTVASRLDIPIGTMRSRIARDRELLRQLMDDRALPSNPSLGQRNALRDSGDDAFRKIFQHFDDGVAFPPPLKG
jgi:RNA polymerase sigma-70 factor (ECF subfamily)